jgi:hypothetical protein
MEVPLFRTARSLALCAALCSCATASEGPIPTETVGLGRTPGSTAETASLGADAAAAAASFGASATILGPRAAELVEALVQRHGEGARPRIERGISQLTAYWRDGDGDAAAQRAFALEWFRSDPGGVEALLTRFSKALEQVDGHMLEIGRALRSWNELAFGPQEPIDDLFAAVEPAAHVSEDLFAGKLAFVALLNFPVASLEEMAAHGRDWSRREWAGVRLARRFALRPSGAALQARARASARAEAYVAGYNLWMHHLLTPDGKRLFPQGVRLLSHWNLRDEIKADYADEKNGLAKQRLLRSAMERIVDQTIPQAVLDDPRVDWRPGSNTVALAPPTETETPTASQGKRAPKPSASAAREPDSRYAVLLEDFKAARLTDRDSPLLPTEIDRRFQFDRELPEARVVQLLESVLRSKLVPRVAALIQKRLGRPLEPHDVWYSGFLARGAHPEEELDRLTRARYPTAEAYKKDIPRLLRSLGFTPSKAAEIDAHIVVDPARGSGHALEAARRSNLYASWGAGDKPHLRTRVGDGGMDYKGYNIAVHEMGHNVEQYFSLYEVDDTLMAGVPNTAFTEALAFTFQNRDLELLGLSRPDAKSERLRVLNDFWATWEISGVALVDLGVWRWMYAHPQATPAELREATLGIARGIWDRAYAKVLGGKGSALLAIYSHMVSSFLYLPDYPLGHLIAFQLEQEFKEAGARSGAAFERAARLGRLSPDLWMESATGRPVSAEPLLRAAEHAVSAEEASHAR